MPFVNCPIFEKSDFGNCFCLNSNKVLDSMSIHSELLPLSKTLDVVIRLDNTLVVSHMDVFGSTLSTDMGIRYTIYWVTRIRYVDGHIVH